MIEKTTTIRVFISDRKKIKDLQHTYKKDTTQETVRKILKNHKGR